MNKHNVYMILTMIGVMLIVVLVYVLSQHPTRGEMSVGQSEDVTPRASVDTVVWDIEPTRLPDKEADYAPPSRTVSYPNTGYSDYYEEDGEEDDPNQDYWEKMRKHSPNDNYLLGFDEDVDDVHDMELYIEDY